MYVFQIFDYYSASGMVLLWFCFFECITIAYVYGVSRFYDNIEEMIGYRLGPWLKICWLVFTPIVTMVNKYFPLFNHFKILMIKNFLQGILLFSIITYTPLTYNRTYVYPLWAQAIGWCMAITPMSLVPLYFMYRLLSSPGCSFREVKWIFSEFHLLKKQINREIWL